MNKILSKNEIKQFREEGAVFLKNKFDISWINKLKKGIEKDIDNPSHRFKSHTIENLKVLSLSSNQLSGQIRNSIGNLSNLTNILADVNRLRNIPRWFKKFKFSMPNFGRAANAADTVANSLSVTNPLPSPKTALIEVIAEALVVILVLLLLMLVAKAPDTVPITVLI